MSGSFLPPHPNIFFRMNTMRQCISFNFALYYLQLMLAECLLERYFFPPSHCFVLYNSYVHELYPRLAYHVIHLKT